MGSFLQQQAWERWRRLLHGSDQERWAEGAAAGVGQRWRAAFEGADEMSSDVDGRQRLCNTVKGGRSAAAGICSSCTIIPWAGRKGMLVQRRETGGSPPWQCVRARQQQRVPGGCAAAAGTDSATLVRVSSLDGLSRAREAVHSRSRRAGALQAMDFLGLGSALPAAGGCRVYLDGHMLWISLSVDRRGGNRRWRSEEQIGSRVCRQCGSAAVRTRAVDVGVNAVPTRLKLRRIRARPKRTIRGNRGRDRISQAQAGIFAFLQFGC